MNDRYDAIEMKSHWLSCLLALLVGLCCQVEAAWWMQDIARQGNVTFRPNNDPYPVFRNVKDYGAKGESIEC